MGQLDRKNHFMKNSGPSHPTLLYLYCIILKHKKENKRKHYLDIYFQIQLAHTAEGIRYRKKWPTYSSWHLYNRHIYSWRFLILVLEICHRNNNDDNLSLAPDKVVGWTSTHPFGKRRTEASFISSSNIIGNKD